MGDWLHDAFHRPTTRAYQGVEAAVWLLVLVSVGLLVAEGAIDRSSPLGRSLAALDKAILVAFALELFLRVASYRPPELAVFQLGPFRRLRAQVLGRLMLMLQPLMLVDLITVLAVVPQLRGLRAFRLLRLVKTARVFRYGNPFEGLVTAFRADKVLFAFAFTVLAVETVVGGISLFLVERGAPGAIGSVGEGLWWALVTITTVGYGDITPVTDLGRVVAGALMVGGMFTLALFAGIVGHSLLNAVLSIREESFRMSGYVDHVVVCGYEPGASLLLKELVEEIDADVRQVVLVGPGERPPELPASFVWVEGDPTKQSELDKVRLTHAGDVVVIGRRSPSPQAADAITLLTLFTIRSYLARKDLPRRRPLHVVAEILDAENVEHARTSGADEVIETRRLGFSMIAHAVAYPGVGNVTSRIVGAGAQNFYVSPVPPELAGATFKDVALTLRDSRGIMVVGLCQGEEHQVNPPDDFAVPASAEVVYLAEGPIL
ncbi:MAG: ion transporter [Myxococcota bacterium]